MPFRQDIRLFLSDALFAITYSIRLEKTFKFKSNAVTNLSQSPKMTTLICSHCKKQMDFDVPFPRSENDVRYFLTQRVHYPDPHRNDCWITEFRSNPHVTNVASFCSHECSAKSIRNGNFTSESAIRIKAIPPFVDKRTGDYWKNTSIGIMLIKNNVE